ncbi:hypothetical protein NA57DRAFT_58646 [Rhizodiscina lignyota]|uniref:Uncharacterized protein n=1 Tax=Rhizodiscina lignyota TaxID=1504668 RepID=A0A9P4I7R0_9PEZI|nr:hypothetical protein NA57DRAFT_58646 [Rhizodiscina lignyota]
MAFDRGRRGVDVARYARIPVPTKALHPIAHIRRSMWANGPKTHSASKGLLTLLPRGGRAEEEPEDERKIDWLPKVRVGWLQQTNAARHCKKSTHNGARNATRRRHLRPPTQTLTIPTVLLRAVGVEERRRSSCKPALSRASSIAALFCGPAPSPMTNARTKRTLKRYAGTKIEQSSLNLKSGPWIQPQTQHECICIRDLSQYVARCGLPRLFPSKLFSNAIIVIMSLSSDALIALFLGIPTLIIQVVGSWLTFLAWLEARRLNNRHNIKGSHDVDFDALYVRYSHQVRHSRTAELAFIPRSQSVPTFDSFTKHSPSFSHKTYLEKEAATPIYNIAEIDTTGRADSESASCNLARG